MNLFIQQTLDGLSSGALYGALALALVLVFRASGIVNFAQAEMALFATFVVWQLYSWGIPLWVAILVGAAFGFAMGATVERVLIRPFPSTDHLPLIIVTLGLMLVVHGMAAWIWGYNTKDLPPVFGSSTVSIGPASMSLQAIGIIVVVAAMSGILWLLFFRTKTGLAIRAASANPESASLSGIPVQRTLLIGWGLAGAVGAVVGALAAPQLFLQPNMVAPLLLYAFAAATLGGFESPVGALVGGLIVGVVENLVATYFPFVGNDFKIGVALAMIVGVLLIRPQGLFGTVKVARV